MWCICVVVLVWECGHLVLECVGAVCLCEMLVWCVYGVPSLGFLA